MGFKSSLRHFAGIAQSEEARDLKSLSVRVRISLPAPLSLNMGHRGFLSFPSAPASFGISQRSAYWRYHRRKHYMPLYRDVARVALHISLAGS